MALTINKQKTAFLSMHFQNDLVCEEGKFGAMGGPAHVKKINCLENTRKVMEACRMFGVPVIHVVGLIYLTRISFHGDLPPKRIPLIKLEIPALDLPPSLVQS